jgi:two-component system OmpR family sensor kinase
MTSDGFDRLAVLVHEVRSPVAALASIADVFGTSSAGERSSLARLAASACAAIERIVADAAVTSIRPTEIDLVRLAEEAARAATLQGSDVRVAATGAVTARADPVRIRQALDNLLSNAARHAPGSEVVVVVERGGGDAVLTVSDSGPGIASRDQARIFEAGIRRGPGAGAGLGLAVARAIAVAHGGELTVASVPGRGSTFSLTLPTHEP